MQKKPAENGIRVNRVMLASMRSGGGKTTVTCALLEILRRRGLAPVSFKCGPDYIDPMFHEQIPGVRSRNLDLYFDGVSGVRRLVSRCSGQHAVIESAMGLYDGIDLRGPAGSGYETAAAIGCPVVLIADAHGAGRTLLSLIRGILADDRERLIRGLILNQISSGYYRSLKPVLEEELRADGYEVRVLGGIPKEDSICLESRHLGLRLPYETENLREKIGKAADLLERQIDVEGFLDLMRAAPLIRQDPEDAETGDTVRAGSRGFGLQLAVARDEAFCFYYRENLEMFERRGVKLRYFSPVRDAGIPEDADGLLLGGGYPELFLPELSGNRSMLASVKKAVGTGMPSLAECGGFMYLHRAVSDTEGRRYDMAGVIDGECRYTGHLVRFGYMQLKSLNSPEAGDPLYTGAVGMKGHEFHYYESTSGGTGYIAGKPLRDTEWNCMIARDHGLWGFPHFYYASCPQFVDRFIEGMGRYHSQHGCMKSF